MKKIIIILLFSLSIPVWGQNLSQKEGAVEIKKIIHHLKLRDDNNLIKKISNRKNRPCQYLYLDTLGNLIKEAGYGWYHNLDLRLLRDVTLYKYEDSKIIESIKYSMEYNDTMRTKYFYDEKNQLIKMNSFKLLTKSM